MDPHGSVALILREGSVQILVECTRETVQTGLLCVRPPHPLCWGERVWIPSVSNVGKRE